MARTLLVVYDVDNLLDVILDTVVGGQAATCPVTNNAPFPLAVFPHDGTSQKLMIDPGKTATVPTGDFGVVAHAPGAGAHGGDCQPGRSFSVTRDDRFGWANVPNVRQQ